MRSGRQRQTMLWQLTHDTRSSIMAACPSAFRRSRLCAPSPQPTAISHQIRRLEEDLGTPLFRRLTRKLQLTEAGRTLLPEVAGAFDKLAGAVERLKASG